MDHDFLIKSEEIPRFGEYPGKRPVERLLKNGIIILDKWPGPTSRDVSSQVRKIFSLKKAAHAGTLDPRVSGVLPVLLENACKVMPALQKQDKEYTGIMNLHRDVDDEALSRAIGSIVGKINQTPPVRSAVARKERKRTVYFFRVLERNGREVLFKIRCEAGTYVRTICHEIGRQIGGAHMSELRRTAAGRFTERNAVKMQDLVDAYEEWKQNGSEEIREFVLPVEESVEHLKKAIVKDSAVFSISQGSPLYAQGIARIQKGIAAGDLVVIMTLRGELVALGNAACSSEEALASKGIAIKTDKVIIEKGIYIKK